MGGQTGPKRTPDQRKLDDGRIEEYMLQGMGVDEITANLNIDNMEVYDQDTKKPVAVGYSLDRSTVFRDMQRIRRGWAERSEVHRELYITVQLKRLEIEYAECWRGYKKSQEMLKERSVKRRGADGSDPKLLTDALANIRDPNLRLKLAQALTITTEQMSKETERLPNYRWLERMLAIHERVAKLLALDAAPQDTPPTNATQVNVYGYTPMSRPDPLPMDHERAAELLLGNFGIGPATGNAQPSDSIRELSPGTA